MLWPAAFAVLVLALLIPVLAVVFDAPFLRRQRGPQPPLVEENDEHMELLAKRLLNLEDEVDDLSQNVRELRDELQYLQRLIDAGQISEPPTRLRPPEA
jgi:hypothetical protein